MNIIVSVAKSGNKTNMYVWKNYNLTEKMRL